MCLKHKHPEAPFLYDFFTNCLPHFYEETCLISSMAHNEILVPEWTPDLCKHENRLNLAVLVKF